MSEVGSVEFILEITLRNAIVLSPQVAAKGYFTAKTPRTPRRVRGRADLPAKPAQQAGGIEKVIRLRRGFLAF
jgi:hypothetical protein